MAVTSVYQYFDARGHLLYVGVTARGGRRGHEHAESKVWWPHCTGSVIEHFPDRESALAREKELIQRHTPPFNTVHNALKERSREQWERRQHAPVVTTDIGTQPLTLKERRALWYKLSAEERRRARCVECDIRPAPNGPSCTVCRPIGVKIKTP